MKCLYYLLLAVTLAPVQTFAKECYAYCSLIIIRESGENDTVLYSFSTTTYSLDQGDQAKLAFLMNGTCMSCRWVVRRNGAVIYDAITMSGFEFDVSTPGFYQAVGYADNFFEPGTFFIANTQVPLVQLEVKAWLQGPYDPDTGSMRDDLRAAGVLPYIHGVDSSMLGISGPHALVDQVFVELRSANSPQTQCDIRPGLLQRNGDIVSLNGTSSLSFGAPAGDYYVVVYHRNHLRAMTATAISLGGDPVTLDFRDPLFPTYGSEARMIEGDAALLWAGNTSNHHSISYTGNYNDRDVILQVVGSDPTHVVAGYSYADVNMDGIVKYTGPDNDRDVILLNLGSELATGVREEQVP